MRLKRCDLCARCGGVDRLERINGALSRTGEHAIVHGYGPHPGGEDPLRGWRGSGGWTAWHQQPLSTGAASPGRRGAPPTSATTPRADPA